MLKLTSSFSKTLYALTGRENQSWESRPLLVTYNDKGEVEGVKYDRAAVVLLNAVKEQQVLIEQQQKQLTAMRKLVCKHNPRASACK